MGNELPTKDEIETYQGQKLNLSMTRFNPATRDIQPTNDEMKFKKYKM